MAGWIMAALLGYAVFAGVVWLSQDKLLYPGSTYDQARLFQFAKELKLQIWPSVASYRGLLSSPESRNDQGGNSASVSATIKGTVIVFHGNGGSALDREFYVDALVPLGYRVLLAEYPGYGARPGKVGEASLVADAKETLRQIRGQFGSPVYVLGESLGAGVAAASISSREDESIDGLVLITPWDSLAGVAADAYPFLPARQMLRDRYDSVRHLRNYAGPLGIVIAENDRTIRAARSAALVETLPNAKRWLIKGADHNDWTMRIKPDFWTDVTSQIFCG